MPRGPGSASCASSTGRTRLQTLVAGLLALGGGTAILYAGFLPIPPFSDVPVPLAWQVFGVIGLAAAVGVFRQQAWGRVLGVVVVAMRVAVAMSLPLAVLILAPRAPRSGPLELFVSLALSVVPDVFVLWVLLRRWRARA